MHLQLLATTVSAASTADSVDPRGQALSCAWVLTSGTSQNIPSCSGPQRVLAASPVARTPPQPWGEGREWAVMQSTLQIPAHQQDSRALWTLLPAEGW